MGNRARYNTIEGRASVLLAGASRLFVTVNLFEDTHAGNSNLQSLWQPEPRSSSASC
jgi:hypothetical protein